MATRMFGLIQTTSVKEELVKHGKGNHDVMRIRTITHHEEMPRFNDEMRTAETATEKHHVFLKYFKKSLRAFSRVMVPEELLLTVQPSP